MASVVVRAMQITRKFSTNIRPIQIPTPWGGYLAGNWWGPTDQRPVLTIHGWQENCGSFNRILPLLNPERVSYLCIDLPGHGWSSRMPKGIRYHYEDFVVLVRYLVDYFQWPKVSFLGHSMGATIGYIYSMCFPNEVDFLVCLEGSKPYDLERLETLGGKIVNSLKYEAFADGEEPPSYTMDVIKEKIAEPFEKSIEIQHSGHIAERAVAPSKIHKDRFYFINDPRIKVGSLPLYSQEESLRLAKRIKCPVYIAYGKDAFEPEPKIKALQVIDELKNSSADCRLVTVNGTHHFHLNNPEVVQDSLNDFLGKYYEPHAVEDVGKKIQFVNAKL